MRALALEDLRPDPGGLHGDVLSERSIRVLAALKLNSASRDELGAALWHGAVAPAS